MIIEGVITVKGESQFQMKHYWFEKIQSKYSLNFSYIILKIGRLLKFKTMSEI